MIRLQVVGMLGQDAKMRQTTGGQYVIDFWVASNDQVKKQDQWVMETTWVKCTKFVQQDNKLIDVLKTGCHVTVEGKPKVHVWWKGEEPVIEQHLIVDNTANGLTLQGKPQNATAKAASVEQKPKENINIVDDDLPF
jgi:single stranded DNA-binding protein